VRFELAAAEGTVLLTGSQTTVLHEWLDARDLAGSAVVVVADQVMARRPFGSRELLIDGEHLVLPGDSASHRWAVDALPAAFLMDLGWLSQPTSKNREGVPWRTTTPPMVVAVIASVWSARRSRSKGATPPGVALALSFGATMLYTIGSSRTMRNTHTPGGVPRYPWVMGLQGYELVRGIAASRLGFAARMTGGAGTASIIAAGWTLSPKPRSRRALAAELGWVVGFDLFARRLRTTLAQTADQTATAAHAGDADVLALAYARGQAQARARVAAELAATFRRFQTSSHHLPPDLAAEARRRIDRVDSLLAIADQAGA
jgi:hypothetical protein